MTKTVAGLFDTPAQAQAALEQIMKSGVPRENIGVACRDDRPPKNDDGLADLTTNTTTGALVGGLSGLLLGLGALAVPGIGPLIAAGPIAATLAGAGIGAAGGLMVGTLRDSGIPEDEAHVYAESVRRGCTLVTVRQMAGSRIDQVCAIMDSAGAVDIEERRSLFHRDGWSRFDEDSHPYQGARAQSATKGHVRAYPSDVDEHEAVTVSTGRTGREVF